MNALDAFVAETRALFARESDVEKRWTSLDPILAKLLADPHVQDAGRSWPECRVIDLVRPYEIHSEDTMGERAVAVIIRSELSGGFMQGRYKPDTNGYWQGLGPRQTRLPFFSKA
jgi:hypothetical protein